MSDDDGVDIAPSKLGTKSYWDSMYEMELHNFEDCGDEGEIWFGRIAEKRIVDFVTTHVSKSAPILDLGCGNGSVLRNLRKKGHTHLTGVDYCPAAIELAKRVSESDQDSSECSINFEVLDILSPARKCFSNQYSVVLDKGTWDAMSLSNDRESRLSAYKTAVIEALCYSGKFVILSCNFTRDELCKFFDDGVSLVFHSEIPPAHSINFGGRQGATFTGIVFEKR
uniref:Protein-lysine N-methyltransferase n=1 Tax=Haemonchus contortus TaxID=6289 RepID=A0A7I4XWJ1_HAECO